MDPADPESLVFDLLSEVNTIIGEVFPACGIDVKPSLQELLAVLKPKDQIKVYSNIQTDAARQGSGLVRTAVFAMLRHHAKMKLERNCRLAPSSLPLRSLSCISIHRQRTCCGTRSTGSGRRPDHLQHPLTLDD